VKRLRQGSRLLVWLALLAIASPLAAQTTITDPTKPAPPAAPEKKSEGAPSPFTLTAAYTADLLAEVSGGRDASVGYVDLLKLSAAYDGANAGHDGLTGLVSVIQLNGSDFTASRVGGIQSVSADEGQPEALRLYEVWLQQEIFGGKGGIKGGLVDINTTFDVQETAALFMNGSHGIGPDLGDTGFTGPSDYPTTALAVTAFYRPAEDWTAQLGVFDGVAGDPGHRGAFVAIDLAARYGALVIGQVEKRFGDRARLEAGAWTYTAAFPSLDEFGPGGAPRRVHGNGGLYGLVEGRLTGAGGDSGGLSGWLRVGIANGDINRAENYFGAGLVYTGLIKGRDKDEIGFAIARAGLGAGARHAGALGGGRIGDAETDLEATYRYAFKDWLNIQPDVQYVIRPAGNLRIPNALVAGLRLAFTFTK
jgi:porin